MIAAQSSSTITTTEVASALLEPLTNGLTQRALVELLILGCVCGPLGVWVVLYQQSYAAESVAHAMLPGLVAAALIGLPLGLGAAAGLAMAVAAISVVSKQEAIGVDVAVGVVVTALFALGSLMALSPATPLRLGEILFGDPLSVSGSDLLATGLLAIVALAVLTASHRALVLSAFDPQSAASFGVRAEGASTLLLGLLVVTTLIGVQALGNLLVVAIVIAPAATALRLASRLVPAIVLSAVVAAAAGVAGIYVSYYADIAAGASVALCAIAAFVITLPLAKPDSGADGSAVERLGAAV